LLSVSKPDHVFPDRPEIPVVSFRYLKITFGIPFPSDNPSSDRISRIRLLGMLAPNVLRYIQLHQGIRQRLTSIPIMVFRIGIERDDHDSIMIDVRDVYIGHVIDCPFSLLSLEVCLILQILYSPATASRPVQQEQCNQRHSTNEEYSLHLQRYKLEKSA
jgi:hypothetical protein